MDFWKRLKQTWRYQPTGEEPPSERDLLVRKHRAKQAERLRESMRAQHSSLEWRLKNALASVSRIPISTRTPAEPAKP